MKNQILTLVLVLAASVVIAAPDGAALFHKHCAVCHGDNGQGGGDGVFPALNPNHYVQENTNAELVKFIQEGREGTAMAAFEGRLNEDEIADIVAHLRTWQP